MFFDTVVLGTVFFDLEDSGMVDGWGIQRDDLESNLNNYSRYVRRIVEGLL